MTGIRVGLSALILLVLVQADAGVGEEAPAGSVESDDRA